MNSTLLHCLFEFRLFNQYYTGKKTIGISCDLGKTNLEQFKKQFHFEYLS